MYRFASTGIAQQIIITAKLPPFIKNIKEEYGYQGFSINSLPQHQTIY